MTNNIEEQVENSTSKIGKFNTADDLLAAYNALESEFTKRCQLIKRLQTELESTRAQAESSPTAEAHACEQPHVAPSEPDRADESISADEQAKTADGSPCREMAEDTASSPEAVGSAVAVNDGVMDEVLRIAHDYAEALAAVPEVMTACITKYKQKLIDARSGAVSPTGMAVIVPALRPRSLADAKRLADEMLK